MKNSPGSMIGGIGLTTCVRDVQFVADDAHHLVDVRVLDAEDDRRIRLLEEAAGALESGGAELLVEEGGDEDPGILVVDDGDDELHPRSIGAASDRGQRSPGESPSRSRGRGRRVYDAPSDHLKRVQECFVSTDGQTSDPRASLASAIEAVAGAGTLEAMLDGVLAAAVAGLAPAMGAIFVSDPDRPGLQLVASHGMDADADARLSAAVEDPADPFTRPPSRGSRRSTARRPRPTARASSVPTSRWSSGSGGVDTVLGSIGLRLAGAARARPDRAGDADRRWPRWPRWPSTGRAWPRRPPSAPNGSSGWPTPTR